MQINLKSILKSKNFKKILVISGKKSFKNSKIIKNFENFENLLEFNYFFKKEKNPSFSELLKIIKIIKKIKPDLIFHLASSANVRESFDLPKKIIENNNSITLNLLEIIRLNKINPLIIICSSSEVYGKIETKDVPVKETKNINPVNPYSVSKAFQDLLSQVYYESYGLKIITKTVNWKVNLYCIIRVDSYG